MKNKFKLISLAVASTVLVTLISTFSLSALADTTVAVKVSTLGIGVDAAFPITESIDARIGINTFSYNINRNSNGTNFSGKLNLGTLEALADWHPWNGGFRMSGGAMYNNNRFSLTAVPVGGVVTIGGVPYLVAQAGTVSSSVDFSKIAPYLGIGWGRAAKNTGFSFATDIGVMFQGTPKTSVKTTGVAVAATDLAKANADLNNALKNFRYYPVVSLGIGYSF